MDRAALERMLADFFMSAPSAKPVIAAYLFGSRARGTERQGSDVDIGVLLEGAEPTPYPDRALEIQCELESRLGLPTQVISLSPAPPDLVHRVLRDGRIVCDRDRTRRIAFEVRSRNEYFDLLPYLTEYRRVRTPR